MDCDAFHQMKVYRPTYVGEFKCDGKLCDARCCHDWNVVVDDATLKKILTLPVADREEFFSRVTELDGDKVLQMTSEGVCPFLDENFLCRLQLKHGENFLAAVCQSYPRVTFKIADGIFSQAMTLTCPVAAVDILLQPIEFEVVDELKSRMVFDFTAKLTMPAEKFLSERQAAVEILQRRDVTINRRLRMLCEHFGEKISAWVEFDVTAHAAALVEIFDEMYDAGQSTEKKIRLVETYVDAREKILSQLRPFESVAENYLVNEFFMRLYPCAMTGDVRFNVRVFVTAWRAVEFAAVMTALSKSSLTVEDFLRLLCFISDKFDHSHGGLTAIKNFAALNDAEIFYALMIDD